ncbi:MAG TPA: lipopolysaccharide heptosyltransferase II [Patescibacteria group bacterium]|nr:lipopolysaccharide heptosyltransferase II [Patescibacteria group bacterium]
MNILQVLPELHVGGVETGTVDLSRRLVRMGHKAVVVSNGGELVAQLEASGAVHYKLPVHKKNIFSMLATVPKLVEIIVKEEIDIIHARSRVPAWIAYLASRRTGKVFITTCHGYYTKHPFSYVMGWAKRVIVLSNVIGRHMIDDFNVPHERIKLVPRSVDLERFRYVDPAGKRKEEFNVGIIGRLTPIKGHLYFIKAMAKLARSVPHVKIWIVGDAPSAKESYKEQIQILIRRLGLWHCTQFLGTQRDIPAVMANLDLLVLATTTQEAFGRVIIEAQAAGVPVVATKVGGAVDIIDDGKTGLLVPPADPTGMAEAALRIFRDPASASRMAEAAHQKVKELYNIERMVKSTLDVYEDALASHKILVIKLSSIGDVILSTAALRAIRQRFSGGYTISVLVGQESRELLFNCPYIDELLVCDLKGKDKGLGGLLRLGRNLRKQNFDMVIDLQNNRKSHILAALSLSLNRYGYDNKKCAFLLNHRLKPDKAALDPVTHQFRVLNMLGIELVDPRLELWPTDEDRRYIDDFLQSEWISSTQRLIGIHLSASPRWETKSWPLHHMARLCEELAHRDIRVVVTGTQQDIPRAQELMSAVKNLKPIDACGKTTINQLACLVKKCSVYISTDSAPLHIAASVGVPFVALFGPTDPRRHLPPAGEHAVITKDLLCSPCYKPKCRHKNCMELIRPEEVLKVIDKLLK